jgi:hypothetical protein
VSISRALVGRAPSEDRCLSESLFRKTRRNVVGFDNDRDFVDAFADAPHLGEDFVRAVRFATGTLDGKAATLALIATRDITDAGIPAPSLVTYEIYRLTENHGGPGTADQFRLIDTSRSGTTFCNAELALSKRFGIPLPADYSGPNLTDGCTE